MHLDEVAARPRTVARSRPPKIELRLDRVQEIMGELGWNPPELARRMGIDQGAVYRLVQGQKQLGMSSLPGLIIALWDIYPDATLDQLFAQLFRVYDYDEQERAYVEVADLGARSGQPRQPRRSPRRPSGGPRGLVDVGPADTHEGVQRPREEADVPALTP